MKIGGEINFVDFHTLITLSETGLINCVQGKVAVCGEYWNPVSSRSVWHRLFLVIVSPPQGVPTDHHWAETNGGDSCRLSQPWGGMSYSLFVTTLKNKLGNITSSYRGLFVPSKLSAYMVNLPKYFHPFTHLLPPYQLWSGFIANPGQRSTADATYLPLLQ